MKIIALAQAYNEATFVKASLDWIYPLVDGIVVSEGLLSPFGNLPVESPDGTRQIIREWIDTNDHKHKCILTDHPDVSAGRDREAQEGINKNNMLRTAINSLGLEDGDVIFVLDFDEFFSDGGFALHRDIMFENPGMNFIRSEEWQFAYGLKWAFKASHGRFYRYKKGSKFGNTNHFFHPNGVDVIKKPDIIVKRDVSGFFHLCWVKHPKLIREKVISFNRPSFTSWFNYVYLVWPTAQAQAYFNNSSIPPYHGRGFCEGQHEPLVEYEGTLPESISAFNVDWTEYIKEHHEELFIQ